MANGYRTRVMGKKKPRRRLGTGARGLALSGEKIFDRRGPYFLFPSNRRSIRKRLASASPYPEVSGGRRLMERV